MRYKQERRPKKATPPTQQQRQRDQVKRAIHELNALKKNLALEWFMCTDCQRLCVVDNDGEQARLLPVNEVGTLARFCAHCVYKCDYCHKSFPRSLLEAHEDCLLETCNCESCRMRGEPPEMWYVPGYQDAVEETTSAAGQMDEIRPWNHPDNGEEYDEPSHPGYFVANDSGCKRIWPDISTHMSAEAVKENHRITDFFAFLTPPKAVSLPLPF